ncbi:M14 family metallopeptidase [Cellulosilyticum lentocellum]|uniref:Peptidase M14 carboxypeptidase A n=1 Tax=Cellulosilyticum lentocellum (strain ATCC 49066 / DSM 5427 / NCIMB 11756 / RHM5) TaxID=642492 RepID=F2JQC8_CELLD|nr:M14 family metallocarboxypeptidase [Cellulosilyticum lentocellum]ADZ83790.1 peptidase M14 carboxypeptidase A [Cellulosilyticum lentocellum DSM 5427]
MSYISKGLVYLENQMYSYLIMLQQLKALENQYPFLKVQMIGKSVMERPLYLIHLGNGKRKIHINGSHHANEWVTSFIVMKSVEKLCEEVRIGQVKLEQINFDFVPMVNPDGVELSLYGLQSIIYTKQKEKLLKMNEGFDNFSRWKANIRGVDLNRNYDADFASYKKNSEKKGPSYAYYAGMTPESEPESKALAMLTRKRLYDMVLAYHTQGEVIYWNYGNVEVPTAKEYAIMFSEASGYLLDEPEEAASSGGYKDWFIATYKKPGFTIECGIGENPISVSQAESIIRRTWPIIKCAQKDIREGVI